jgi:hypothetical protein
LIGSSNDDDFTERRLERADYASNQRFAAKWQQCLWLAHARASAASKDNRRSALKRFDYAHARNNATRPESKNMTRQELFVGRARYRTGSAGTKRSQIVVCVNSRTVPILPPEFDGVIAHRTDFLQLCSRNRNKSPLCSMSLAHGTWAVAAQILVFVLPHMAIVPSNPHRTAGFYVIDLSGK